MESIILHVLWRLGLVCRHTLASWILKVFPFHLNSESLLGQVDQEQPKLGCYNFHLLVIEIYVQQPDTIISEKKSFTNACVAVILF